MRAPGIALVALLLGLLAAGCAGGMTRNHGTGPLNTRPAEVQGRLVEVRHYLEAGSLGGDHTFCAYQSALAGSPLGIVTENSELVILTSIPARLAMYVTRMVRITGELTQNSQLLVPSAVRIHDGARWTTAGL